MSAPPRETPIADPRVPVVGLRLAALTFAAFLVAQWWLRPAWEAWGQAAAHAVIPQAHGPATANVPLRLAGTLIQQLYRPTTQWWLRAVAFALLALLLLELGQRLVLLTSTFLRPARERTRFFRVRVLTPANRVGFPASAPAEQLQALAAAARALRGVYVALALTRTPNQPATLGVQISTRDAASARAPAALAPDDDAEPPGLTPRVRKQAALRRRPRRPLRPVTGAAPVALDPADRRLCTAQRVLASTLSRFDETVLLDAQPDPLAAALADNAVLLTQEYALARPAHWPLRQRDELESDLLRSLAQSLAAAAGVHLAEIQISLAPARLVGTMRWYALARRTVQRLKREVGPLGSDDQRAVSAKLGDTHLWASLRVAVVVAGREDIPQGQEALRVVEATLRTLDRRYQGAGLVTVEQRLTPITGMSGGRTPAAALTGAPPRPPALLTPILTALTLAVALLTLGLFTTWQLEMWHTWPALPPWLRAGGAALLLSTYALAGGAGIWAAVCLRSWRALHRVGRPELKIEPQLLFGPGISWSAPALLGARELASLWHLSDEQTTREIDTLPNRFLPAPASAFVPDGATSWVVLGQSYDSAGTLRPVGLPLTALHQMLHVTAGMGAGKSQAAAAMCEQLIPHGFIILDGKGDDEGGGLAAVVRRLIPPEEEHRLCYLNVLETAFPIGLNPIYHFMVAMEQAPSKAARDLAFNAALGLILGLFQRLDPERWEGSPGMQQYALMGCHLVLRTGSSKAGEIPTMAKVARALEDETYRKALIARYPFTNDSIYRFWTEREEQLSEAQRSSLHALLRRLDLFMANPITRPMLSVERPSIDLRRAMDAGQIVLIPMPHRNLGGLAPLVGMLILQSLVAAAYARAGDALSRVTAPVFIDEVQVFVVNEQSPDLEQAFTQLRGFAVPLIVLHQGLDQLGALRETFCINAANRLILRTTEPDASTYAKMYSQAGLRPEDIKAMHALHHQYAVTQGPNREQLVFSLLPNPWPARPEHRVPLQLGARDWQAWTPPPDPSWSPEEAEDYAAIDRLIAAIFYRDPSPADFDRITGQLAQLPEPMWEALLEQWERVRAWHYQALLDQPGLIPDQLRRQTWLTNLIASRGAVIEEALTLRQELRGMASAAAALAPVAVSAPPRDMLPPSGEDRLPPPALPATGPRAGDLARQGRPRPEERPTIAGALRRPAPQDHHATAEPSPAPQEAP